jgi:U3 small nucleolar RNA-associated protein 3
MLKSKRISVQNHPVIKRLVQFRSLLHQLETAGSSLQAEIDELLSKIKKKKPIKADEYTIVKAPPRKKLRILSKSTQEEPELDSSELEPSKKKSLKKTELLTKDEQDALEFYSALKKRKQKGEEEDESEGASDEGEEQASNGTEEAGGSKEEETAAGRRAINYQIAKNKGLTPHRQKEQRNPRVKHRMKFRKAKIRRKGQVST